MSFFLNPGEVVEGGIQKNYILGDGEALLLKALEEFKDTDEKGAEAWRKAGSWWMIYGPANYVPPVEV